MLTGFISQCTSDKSFAYAGRTADDQVVSRTNPVKLCEFKNSRAGDISWDVKINILDGSRKLEPGIFEFSLSLVILSTKKLFFDYKRKAFVKGELLISVGVELFVDGVDHTGEFHLGEFFNRLLEHDIFPLSLWLLLKILTASKIVVNKRVELLLNRKFSEVQFIFENIEYAFPGAAAEMECSFACGFESLCSVGFLQPQQSEYRTVCLLRVLG